MNSLELKIAGMHCNGCANTIQALLSHEDGIQSANVSFSTGKASVLYDSSKTTPANVAAAIEKAGYRVSGGQSCAAA